MFNCNSRRRFQLDPHTRPAVIGISGFAPGQVDIVRSLPSGWVCQWQHTDGTPFVNGLSPTGATISGASTAILHLSGISQADEGTYVFAAGATPGTIAPVDTCDLYVNRAIPLINSMPTDREACLGATTTFRVDTVGTGLQYLWTRDGTTLANGPTTRGDTVSGSGTAQVAISGLNAQSPGLVNCTIVGNGYAQTTPDASLTVSSNAAPPIIITQPVPVTFCGNSIVAFSVGVAVAGSEVYAYQWRRNGAPLVDNGRLWGSNWPTLEINNPIGSDAGAYDCLISRGCVSTTSNAATLTICAADFNCDGFLDFTDFDGFVTAFEAGDPASDFNADGFLDFTDFDAFVAAFEAGC